MTQRTGLVHVPRRRRRRRGQDVGKSFCEAVGHFVNRARDDGTVVIVVEIVVMIVIVIVVVIVVVIVIVIVIAASVRVPVRVRMSGCKQKVRKDILMRFFTAIFLRLSFPFAYAISLKK